MHPNRKRIHAMRELRSHVLDAKREWENAGGSINERVSYHREWADTYASHLSLRIEWHSIHPSIHFTDGTELIWSEFLPWILNEEAKEVLRVNANWDNKE